MPEPDARGGGVWESGWEGHSDAQRGRLARLTLREKLRWLEEAQRIIHHLRKNRGSRTDGAPVPRGKP